MSDITVSGSGGITIADGGDVDLISGSAVNITLNASSTAERTIDAAITGGVTSSVAPDTNFASDYVGISCIVNPFSSNAELSTIAGVGSIEPIGGGTFSNSHSSGAPVLLAPDGMLNVLWYGATGDGATNDATAIQAAIDEAAEVGWGVYFPQGKYLISTTLNLKDGLAGLRGMGGLLQSSKNGSTILMDTAADSCIENNTAGRLYNQYIKDIGFDTTSGTTGGTAIHLKDCNNFLLDGVTVKREIGSGYDTSLKIESTAGNGAYYNMIRGCTLRQKASATEPNVIITSPSTGPGANSNYFVGGAYQGYGTGTGDPNILIEYSDNIVLMAVALEGGYEYAIACTGSGTFFAKVQAFGCRFESSNGTPKSISADSNTKQAMLLGNTYTSSFTFSDSGEFNVIEEFDQVNFNRKHVVTDGSNSGHIVDLNSTAFGSTYASDDGVAVYNSSGSRLVRFRTNGNLAWGSADDVVLRKVSSGMLELSAGDIRATVENGTTGSRPGSPGTGQMYFDTTLGTPIWYDGTNWVDSAGTTV